MAREKLTTSDFLFRDGQAYIGTQDGKRNEMIHDTLGEQRVQTNLLREMTRQQRQTTALTPYYSPSMTPHIDIAPPDIRGLADELRPEFRNLVAAQKELGMKVSGLGYLGQMALQESFGQTAILDSLDSHAAQAYLQRNAALDHMSKALAEHRMSTNMLIRAKDGIADVDRNITGVRQGISSVDRNITGVRQGISSLDQNVSGVRRDLSGVRREIGLSTAILSNDISVLNESLTGALGDLGYGIHELTGEMVKTKLAVVQAIQDSQAIFLWSHREQMWVRKQVLDVLRNPRHTAAHEAWQIGEQCRLAGDNHEAVRMYGESLRTNPSETRNHISLGLMSLGLGQSEEAKKHFANGVRYAQQPQIKATAIMHLAKIEMFDKNFTQAKVLLDLAMETDVTNLEVWFDLAICEMKLGNTQQALYYIRNLLMIPLRVSKKRAPAAAQYALKIAAETAFNPIMPNIRQIMREIISNAT